MKNSIFVIIFMATLSFCAQGIEVEYKKENVKTRVMFLENTHTRLKLHHIFIIKDVIFNGTPYGLWSTLGDILHYDDIKNKNKITKIWSAIKQKCGARPDKKIDYIEARVDAQEWNKEEAYDLVIQTLGTLEQVGYHNKPFIDISKPSVNISYTNPALRTEINFNIEKKRYNHTDESTRVLGDISRFIGPEKPSSKEIDTVEFVYYPRNNAMNQIFQTYYSDPTKSTCLEGPLVYSASPLQEIKEIKALLLRGKPPWIDPKPKNEVTK